jgi:hypothetical protein
MGNTIGKYGRSYWKLPIFIAIRKILGFWFIFDLILLRIGLVLISKNTKASTERVIHWQHQVKDR